MNDILPLSVMAVLAMAAVIVIPLAGSAEAQSIGTLADIVDTVKTSSTTYGQLPPQNPGTSTVDITFKRPVSGISADTFLVDGMPTTAYICVDEVYTLTFAKAIRPDATVTVSIKQGESFTSGGLSGCTPGTPDNLTATAGTPSYSAMTLTWDAAINSRTYTVQYKNSTSSWNTFNDGSSSATSETITGLNPNTTYQFRVAGNNGIVNGDFTNSTSKTTTTAVAPNPPRNLVADQTGTSSIMVTWDRPVYNSTTTGDGGAPITKYFVEYKNSTKSWGGTNSTFVSSTDTNAHITGLTQSTTYNFRVTAANSIDNSTSHDGGSGMTRDQGSCNDTSNPKAYPKGCGPPGTEKPGDGFDPGTPRNLDQIDVRVGNTLNRAGALVATFTWDPPHKETTPNRYYVGYYTGGGYTWACQGFPSSSPCSSSDRNAFGGPNNYPLITIRADRGGHVWGEDRSYPITLVRTAGPPHAVDNLVATKINATAVQLDWKKPFSNAAVITDYVVQQRIGSTGNWMNYTDGVSTNTNSTITGLDYATQYEIRVAAANSAGVDYDNATQLTYTTELRP